MESAPEQQRNEMGSAYLGHTDRGGSALCAMLPLRNMRITTLLFTFLLVGLGPSPVQAQSELAIGQWRDHFSYTTLLAVAEGGGKVYACSSNGLFQYDPVAGEVERLNKTNALSDVGIQGLAWNEALGALLVYYSNGNLDLLKGENSWNIGDIERSSIIGNKGVYCAYMDGTTAYLGCGFGIVVLDLAAREVRETWFIGPSGSQVRINGIAMSADSIYAACGTGLFVASRTAGNLASFENWRKRTDMGSTLAAGPFNAVAHFGDRILLNAQRTAGGDTLLVLGSDDTWTRFEPLFGRANRGLAVSADGQRVVIAHDGDIHTYNASLNEISYIYGYAGGPAAPAQAIPSGGGVVWVADRGQGLVRSTGYDMGSTIIPNGPRTTGAWRMDAGGGALYVATGAVTGTWVNTYLKEGVHQFVDGEWSTIDRLEFPLMNGVNEFAEAANDIIAVAVDPDDPHHAFAGSWDEGLIEIRNGAPVEIYNATNSALTQEANPYQGRIYVSGLAFDRSGTLWMSNAQGTGGPIVARTKEGAWYAFDPGNLLNGNLLMSDVIAAQNGYKWFIRPRGNAILVYDSGTSVESTDDDRYALVTSQPGTGGLPTPDVYALAEDLDEQIWIGTNRGVLVIYTPEVVFSGEEFDAQEILIEQDGNVQILLETETVNAIKVDGANRKWIGTQASGAFLLSPDGREEILHFTAENSPLPSNTVNNIAVDGATGEVFIGTDRGIMSFRGSAIDGADESECASVFPNPVRETYTGPIAITGLVRNSEVKITDVSGNLVYRTTSEGGQAIWYGNDMSGQRASTGVYLVFASDASGTTKCNTKVLLVR